MGNSSLKRNRSDPRLLTRRSRIGIRIYWYFCLLVSHKYFESSDFPRNNLLHSYFQLFTKIMLEPPSPKIQNKVFLRNFLCGRFLTRKHLTLLCKKKRYIRNIKYSVLTPASNQVAVVWLNK